MRTPIRPRWPADPHRFSDTSVYIMLFFALTCILTAVGLLLRGATP
jgi:hypothetical protein